MPIELTTPKSDLESKFFSLQKPEDVADLLELSSYSFLEYTIFVLPASKKYKRFIIPKRRGGQRIIQEPTTNLKIIQHKLLQVLEVVYKPKPAVHGFVSERSIVTNAKPHIKSRFVLNVDLKDFFPSIHFGRVRGMLMAYPYNFNNEVATVLAQICSLSSGLPQGSPTSPIISNMICAKMDSQLQSLAKRHHCHYTRYADDITFSTSRRKFPAALAVLISDEDERHVRVGDDLRSVIHSNGFKINTEKVRLQTQDKRQEVTGLTTNKLVNVNRKFIRQIRAMLHAWSKYGFDAAETEYRSKYCHKKLDKPYKVEPSFRHVVKGKIEFIGMVRGRTDKLFVRLNNQAAQLEQDSCPSPYLFTLLADPDSEILSLISAGETEQVEFKVAACLNPHTNKADKTMRENILEEVAAFLNSEVTGTILVGVGDDGRVWGIEREYETANSSKKNWDGYELFLTNVLTSSLSHPNSSNFFKISQHRINGKFICSIKTTPADKPILAKGKLFIRVGTQCKELKPHEVVEHIMDKARQFN